MINRIIAITAVLAVLLGYMVYAAPTAFAQLTQVIEQSQHCPGALVRPHTTTCLQTATNSYNADFPPGVNGEQSIFQANKCGVHDVCYNSASNTANIQAPATVSQSIGQANNCGVDSSCFNSASNTANIQAPATVSQSITQANNCGVHCVGINGVTNTQAPVTRLQSITR